MRYKQCKQYNQYNQLFVCSFVSQNTNAPYESTNQPTDGTIKKQIGRHYKQKKNKKSKDLTALVLKLLAGPDYFSKDEIPLSTGVSMIGIVVSVPDNSTMHYDDCTIVVFRLDPHQKVVCVDTNSTVEKIKKRGESLILRPELPLQVQLCYCLGFNRVYSHTRPTQPAVGFSA